MARRSRIYSLEIEFSENVNVDPGALRFYNNTMSRDVTPAGGVAYDPIAGGWDMSGVELIDGNYTAALSAAGVTDDYGNELDGDGDGVGGDDYTFEFYVLRGDIDAGRSVSESDYESFIGRFGLPSEGHQADLNNDGRVDLADFAIMRAGGGDVIDARSMLLADADFNGAVDVEDLKIVVACFGQTGEIGTMPADFDRNGIVDDLDVSVWAEEYSPPAPAPVASQLSATSSQPSAYDNGDELRPLVSQLSAISSQLSAYGDSNLNGDGGERRLSAISYQPPAYGDSNDNDSADGFDSMMPERELIGVLAGGDSSADLLDDPLVDLLAESALIGPL